MSSTELGRVACSASTWMVRALYRSDRVKEPYLFYINTPLNVPVAMVSYYTGSYYWIFL